MHYQLQFDAIYPYIPQMLQGLNLSLWISCLGMVMGSLLGITAALALDAPKKSLRLLAECYVELFRNTPMLIQMYFLYFGLAQIEIQFSPFWAAVLAMILNNGAYTAIIFRSGIRAVDIGQSEAGMALGMKKCQIFCHVVFPQAFRIVIPPLTNQFISLFLFSSVASSISLAELTYYASSVESSTMRTFETFILVALLYLLVTSVITVLSSLYERFLRRA